MNRSFEKWTIQLRFLSASLPITEISGLARGYLEQHSGGSTCVQVCSPCTYQVEWFIYDSCTKSSDPRTREIAKKGCFSIKIYDTASC